MDRSDVLTLIRQNISKGADGIQKQQDESKRQVFCNVSSVSGTEWLEAGRNGIKPEYRFTVFAPDYAGETVCEYNGSRYSVYRTYQGKTTHWNCMSKRKAVYSHEPYERQRQLRTGG